MTICEYCDEPVDPPLPEQIANLKFERIGISEYRVSLI